MATFAEITEVRLAIDDPHGFVTLTQVADVASLPAVPTQQTVYKVTATGSYMFTELESGATAADYDIAELRVSDVSIATWIDANDVATAIRKSILYIIAKLARELQLQQSTNGADSKTYQDLSKLLAFYEKLRTLYGEDEKKDENTSTGVYARSHRPYVEGQW